MKLLRVLLFKIKTGDINPVEATTIDEVCKFVPFKRKVQCFVTPSKLWYKSSCGESYYGIVFKFVKLCSKHPERVQGQLELTNLHEHFQSEGQDEVEDVESG